MRRIVLASIGALILGGCANPEAPPGGPEDRRPPEPVVVRPDSLSIVTPSREAVRVVFDEQISEQGLTDAVLVSPLTSPLDVDHRSDEIRVRLRRGWEPGIIYHVTVLPGIRDRFGNRRTEPVEIVFSTGPVIPATRLTGAVADRITGKPEVGVRVEAIRAADSLVYALPTDSAGTFTFTRIPEGDYRVRAYRDVNRSRALDPYEPRAVSTAQVREADTATVSLALIAPDSTPPVASSAQVVDGAIQVKFDDHLDPDQPLRLDQVRLVDPSGAPVAIERVALGIPATATDTATADTTRAQGTLPSQVVSVWPAAPLRPGARYRVSVMDVRNLVGLAGGGEVEFEVPEQAPSTVQEPEPGIPGAGPESRS